MLVVIIEGAQTRMVAGVTEEVVLVHEEFSVRETWPLECLSCRHIWQEDYTVRHLTDEHGHDVVVWLREGVPVQPPWAGSNCPGCGVDQVSAFPRGEYARSGTLAAVSAVEPGRPPVERLYSPAPPHPPIALY
ncbi:hypothetical protein HS041_24850 [Planomonospora sp. ID67723]|uniref:hypothetical protein n=1 Tax=Planomonospora sp. ID67723 TaxID=2738134 RepID=UPI0018C43DD4|nr:hypothetical protein [Planomonospora sp. ID67723]MBG0830992.1 hypothetical protein [Planomonospora sp. ID67723]